MDDVDVDVEEERAKNLKEDLDDGFDDLEEGATTMGLPPKPYDDWRFANAPEKSLREAEEVFWTREAVEVDAEAVAKDILTTTRGVFVRLVDGWLRGNFIALWVSEERALG